MAVGLVGGMLVSTVMTLFVVPAAYSSFDDLVNWNEERMKRRRESRAGALQPAAGSARMAEAPQR